MPEAIIQYVDQPAKVNCDGRCKKAWGINSRPKVQVSNDEDDYEFLADHELGEAPINPGTFEGGDAKPKSSAVFPNKWCVRECERCNMSQPGKYNFPLAIKSFDDRVSNTPDRFPVGKAKIRQLVNVKFDGKWAELWFADGSGAETFDQCCKAYMLREAIRKSGLSMHTYLHGVVGIWLAFDENDDPCRAALSEVCRQVKADTQPELFQA